MDLVRIEREGLQLEQGLGGVFLEWDFDLDGGLAVQAKNREPMLGAISRRQTLADIVQGAIRRLPAELGPVVDDFQQTALSQAPHADLYAPPLFASGDCALDAVLHQRFVVQWRDVKVIKTRHETYKVSHHS